MDCLVPGVASLSGDVSDSEASAPMPTFPCKQGMERQSRSSAAAEVRFQSGASPVTSSCNSPFYLAAASAWVPRDHGSLSEGKTVLALVPWRFHDMTEHEEQRDSLDESDPRLKRKNAKFDQERADSLDHAKQSGKGERGNKLPKPAGDELAKP